MGRSDCLVAYQLAPARWIELLTLSSSLLGGERRGSDHPTMHHHPSQKPCNMHDLTSTPDAHHKLRDTIVCRAPVPSSAAGRVNARTRRRAAPRRARRELHRETRRNRKATSPEPPPAASHHQVRAPPPLLVPPLVIPCLGVMFPAFSWK
jgi:hypothetical protein